MKELNLSDINIHDIGNTIQISGVVYSGQGKNLICYFPDELNLNDEDVRLVMDLQDWKKFIRQTDLLETEILAKDDDNKIIKAVFRKSQRQIDSRIQWKVFQRDNYRCRYCGKTGIPLTVDHLILWEEGGMTIEDNLLTACKKCNKTRGNMQYEEWLKDDYYKRVSINLDYKTFLENSHVVEILKNLPKQIHKRSR